LRTHRFQGLFAAANLAGNFARGSAVEAWQEATNAVSGPNMPLVDQVSAMGSFTEPE
jgi:hypothetical protein